MAEVVDFSGDNDISAVGVLNQNTQVPDLVLSLGRHVDVYLPRKRTRVRAPFIAGKQQKSAPSINILPDECLFEVFRRLEGGQEKSSCAFVSKRWLMLLSGIGRGEICTQNPEPKENREAIDLNVSDEESHEANPHGFLSRCLEGRKASDVRLAAISVGTASRGGLGKLSIRGNNSTRKLTDLGLKAVSRGCPSLKALSLWNVSTVGDEGLSEIATGCSILEELDLCHCPTITDKGLIKIATNCPNLTSVTLDSCSNISNESLKSLGQNCPNLESITVKNCPRVGDQGIGSLFTSLGHVIAKANFHALGMTDMSLAVIGHYGSELTELTLGDLLNVKERGFWLMGNGQGLQKLKSLSITSCNGVSDGVLDCIARGCPNLKMFALKKCPLVSNNGVVAFSKAGNSLESLKLEEIHRVNQLGLFGVLANQDGKKLKALTLVNCLGIRDATLRVLVSTLCYSLRSLTIRNCPGVGDFVLGVLGGLCPNLTRVELTDLPRVTDSGILPLFSNLESGVSKVNLSGCMNLTDYVVFEITKLHGMTLEVLNLDGCKKVSDLSLMAVAKNCSVLRELIVSGSKITDDGIGDLARAKHLSFKVLSFEGCSLMTEKSLPFLGILGKNLIGLNIKNCSGIRAGTVNLLMEKLWRCDILSD